MNEIFDQSQTFSQMNLSEPLLRGLAEAGFVHPTMIQAKLLPAILSGSDVIGQAKTGTGKTAAFGLPVIQMADPKTPMQALILTPTRELAAQVAKEISELGKYTPIRAVCIIGGESVKLQNQKLQSGTQIMVGTPGRVMDLLERGWIHFDNLRWAILDEVDRMFDIGFRDDIRKILGKIKREHQTVFVSATLSPEIESLARKSMKPDTKKIVTVSGALTLSLVDQKYLSVEPWDKAALLMHLLKHEEPDTTLIFCRTKQTVHRLTQRIRASGVDVREIHGDLAQSKRTKVMDSMRAGKLDVLVASDLAARGLDVEHITHVINYDLPEDPEVYIHRIGRTARAGRRGIAWSFVTRDQGQLLTEIEKLAGTMIEKMEYPDFTPGPVPSDVALERQRSEKKRSDPQKTLQNRAMPRIAAEDLLNYSPEELKRMFPDGLVPKSPPPASSIGRRFRRRQR